MAWRQENWSKVKSFDTGQPVRNAQADLGRYILWILLTLSQTSPGFLRVCGISVLKTLWEKEKLLVTSNFPFSYSVFYTFLELSAIYIKFEIVVC